MWPTFGGVLGEFDGVEEVAISFAFWDFPFANEVAVSLICFCIADRYILFQVIAAMSFIK
jgi:hypothetical protein